MQKWEYLFVRLDYFAGDLRPKLANGKELPAQDGGISLHEYANQAGEEGWELVGMNYTPTYGYGFLVFKRPKLEEVSG
ncbi:MAG: hypothetical protein KME26_25870 [Oscillatoria princeps RMCB-10]|jgi:hypothetical protein|nr:hypothetical protein [Oscillatoria princeps RMCB-10]